MATHNNSHIMDAVRSSTNRSYCSISPLPPSPNASPTAFRTLSTFERSADLVKATEHYSDPFVTTESDTFESSSTATAAALTGVSECGALMAPSKSEWQCGRRVLGKGSFGIVHLGINKRTGELCAVKSVTLENPSSRAKSMLRGLENEVHILSSLSHPNIVRYLGFEAIPDGFNIFLEYIAGGSIAQLLRHFGPLHEDVVRGYVRQLLEGLSYLHGLGILHRDIKGGNMLVTERGVIKLSDFGSCKSLQEIVSSCKATVIGTVEWMSPEAITGHNVAKPSDLWSVGCTVIEMLTAETPWAQTPHEGLCGVSLMYWIATSGSRPLCPPAYRGGQVEAFLGRCLCQDPAERATVSDLLLHPWIEAAPLPEPEGGASPPAQPQSPTNSPVSQKQPQFTRPEAESDVPLILAGGGLVSPHSSPPGLQQARAIFSFLKANAHQLESSLFPQQASSGSNSNSNSSSLSDQPVFTRTETLECSASGAVKLKQQERRLRSVMNPVTRVADEWVLTDELESSHGNSGTPTSLKYTLTAKKGGSPLRANKRPGAGGRQAPTERVPRICEVSATGTPRPVSASPPISISSDCDSAVGAHALQLRREPSENTKLEARWKMFNSAAHQALQARDNQISSLQSRMDAVDSQITSMQRTNREGARLEVSYSPRPRTPKRRRRRDWDATSAFAVGVALTAIVAMVLIHRTKP